MRINNFIPIFLEQRRGIIATSGNKQTKPIKIKRPKWDDVYHGYPKVNPGTPSENDMPASKVFTTIFGSNYDKTVFSNACATRVSLGLINAKIKVKTEYTIKEGPNKDKGITVSAANMGTWLKEKQFGKPDEEIKNPKSFNEVADKIGDRKGIYILISNDARWASGHATLWHDGNAIGGHNYYEHAKVIYFWELK
ncbi:T6SS effector amidase Tae4 family protein [Chryseobacterium lactis]|nr:T6SS effector amidase Tae4 family protein [Chryseobacterium lactis]